MRANQLTGIVLGVCVGLASTHAAAFCRSSATEDATLDENMCRTMGPTLYWRAQCVTYRLHRAASAQFSLPELDVLMRQAFAVWTNPGTRCLPSISAIALAPTINEVGYDESGPNENVVILRDEDWDTDRGSVLALTTVTMDTDTGEILDADIEINTRDNVLSPSNLRYVLTHEIGHFLGLAHSAETDALMHATYDLGSDAPPQLSADDAAGICAIYPEEGDRVTLDPTGIERHVSAQPCPPFGVDPGVTEECGPGVVENGCSVEGPGATRSERASYVFAGLLGALFVARKRRRS